MLDAKKVLVLVNGNTTDAAMIALAAQTAKRNKAQVYAIHVIEVRRTLPLDADLVEERRTADAILDEAERKKAVREIIIYMLDTSPYTFQAGVFDLNASKKDVMDTPPEGKSLKWSGEYDRVWRKS